MLGCVLPEKDGVVIKDRVLKDAYTPIQTPRLNVPFSSQPGWGKDYADATTFYGPLFDGRNIIPKNNTNYSLLGITPADADPAKIGLRVEPCWVRGCRAAGQ